MALASRRTIRPPSQPRPTTTVGRKTPAPSFSFGTGVVGVSGAAFPGGAACVGASSRGRGAGTRTPGDRAGEASPEGSAVGGAADGAAGARTRPAGCVVRDPR